MTALFPDDGKLFTNPKPVRLLEHLMSFVLRDGDIFLDFFAGSCASADAVFRVAHKNACNHRFIIVQLPESVSDNNEAGRNAMAVGYSNIAQLGRERIRRAGQYVDEEGSDRDRLDVGFRVLKVDNSNMKDVYYTPDAVEQKDLLGHAENVKDDRTDEDLLFQVLLDWGVDLSLPITPETIAGKTVYFVDENALAACFEAGIDEEFVKKLAERKPLRAVFRDAGYGTDSTKINVEQIFKLISPTTEVKTL